MSKVGKRAFLLLLAIPIVINVMAQETKKPTLEDLIPGGESYRYAENLYGSSFSALALGLRLLTIRLFLKSYTMYFPAMFSNICGFSAHGKRADAMSSVSTKVHSGARKVICSPSTVWMKVW